MELEEVVKVLKKHMADAKIIIFGSRARGNALKSSDIDMIIISKIFENMHFTDRAPYVLKILWRNKVLPAVSIDVLCYTPNEFEKKKREIGIVREAVHYGIELE
ncbi:MAG: nucleotidyltransferase domain-containing protein [Nitrososphaerota archaeon]|nr:nucleotidyltransferase domain-containing protein [Nitrososphaerota archaeon]